MERAKAAERTCCHCFAFTFHVIYFPRFFDRILVREVVLSIHTYMFHVKLPTHALTIGPEVSRPGSRPPKAKAIGHVYVYVG